MIRLADAICVLDQRDPKYMKCAISAIIGRLKNLSRTLIGVRISLRVVSINILTLENQRAGQFHTSLILSVKTITDTIDYCALLGNYVTNT